MKNFKNRFIGRLMFLMIAIITGLLGSCEKDDPAPNPLIGNWGDGQLLITYPGNTTANRSAYAISFTEKTLIWEDGKIYNYVRDNAVLTFTPHLKMESDDIQKVQFNITEHSWGTDVTIVDLGGRAADGYTKYSYTYTKAK